MVLVTSTTLSQRKTFGVEETITLSGGLKCIVTNELGASVEKQCQKGQSCHYKVTHSNGTVYHFHVLSVKEVYHFSSGEQAIATECQPAKALGVTGLKLDTIRGCHVGYYLAAGEIAS